MWTQRYTLVVLGRAAVAVMAVIVLAIISGTGDGSARRGIVPAPAPGPTPVQPYRPATPAEQVRHDLRQQWEIEQARGRG